MQKAQFTLEITIPANTTASVYVPADEGAAVTEGGQPAEKAPGVTFVKYEGEYAVYTVGSGIYRFVSRVKK
ncbi:MAG: alpha-L-rhamnosidase C-terminal domain-containing protein [Candidatus Latescibacter sp.]|nr:alpha-L-rhamnosidase C-terminal domain-containing protein [Candidatus Latescibacter sp.]